MLNLLSTITIWSSRLKNGLGLVLIGLLLLIFNLAFRDQLWQESYYSGWLLLIMVVLLAGYHLRKVFVVLPLGSTGKWLNLHIIVGVLSGFVFLLHVDFSLPNGVFEMMLFTIYGLAFLSGLLGWFFTRIIPARLSNTGIEVIYEQIPQHRLRLWEALTQSISEVEDHESKQFLTDLCERELKPWMNSPPHWTHYWGSRSQDYLDFKQRLNSSRRFVQESEYAVIDQFEEAVTHKHLLDIHLAQQRLLKFWQWGHVPLSYSLLIFSIFHALIVHAFL